MDSKPALRGSNIPAIQLWQKPWWANLFDGQVAAGPIPVLLSQFAEDPDLIQVTIVPALVSLSPFFFPTVGPRTVTSIRYYAPKTSVCHRLTLPASTASCSA